MGMMEMRGLTDALFGGGRGRLFNIASKLFNGRRDLYKSLGYSRVLLPADYRSRYRRNAVANRIVKALPKATWRGGAELFDDETEGTTTEFEQAWSDLNERLNIWDKFYRADVLAGIGRYAVIVITAPGEPDTPLDSAGPEEIAKLTPYAEEDATIEMFETDAQNERFGMPTFYRIKRTAQTTAMSSSANLDKRFHWTRVIHVADGLLDDDIFGEPRLECIWNDLDDLEKVKGAGAEAFWKRADGGMQFDLDPTLDFNDDSKIGLKKQLHEYEHDLRRMLLTRGVKVSNLGSAVADFSGPVESIVSIISAGTGIPQRILMGSERGQLASTQDRSNWDDRVVDRRNDYAIPYIIRPFVARMQGLGVLPEAKDKKYTVEFSALRVMDDTQRAETASKWAALNSAAGVLVVTENEIREKVLGLPPIQDVKSNDQEQTVEEEAMTEALKRAIASNNTPMLEILLGLDPVVRTIGVAGEPSSGNAPEVRTLQAQVAALQALAGHDDKPLRELTASLAEGLRAMAGKESIVNVNPVVQVPQPSRKFHLKVNRDAKGLMTHSTIEEIE